MSGFARTLRTLYLALSAGQVGLGLIHISFTPVAYDGLSTRALWFASGGIAIALTGALNLLRGAYGRSAPGVRRVAVAANGAMAVMTILQGVAMHVTWSGWAFVAVLTGGPAALSLVPSTQRPAPAAA